MIFIIISISKISKDNQSIIEYIMGNQSACNSLVIVANRMLYWMSIHFSSLIFLVIFYGVPELQ
jgi:hypothetical protein